MSVNDNDRYLEKGKTENASENASANKPVESGVAEGWKLFRAARKEGIAAANQTDVARN